MSARLGLACHELRRLYIDEGLSQAKVAEALGCSAATVGVYMRRCGIPARNGRFRAREIPEALLASLYRDEGLTLAMIAARLGVSVSTVHNWRRACGLPPRPRRWPAAGR